MRILDDLSKNSIDYITISLEKQEARQLIAYLEALMEDKTPYAHYHLNNEDYTKEITVELCDARNPGGFNNK